jgi:hypothetical protein
MSQSARRMGELTSAQAKPARDVLLNERDSGLHMTPRVGGKRDVGVGARP